MLALGLQNIWEISFLYSKHITMKVLLLDQTILGELKIRSMYLYSACAKIGLWQYQI